MSLRGGFRGEVMKKAKALRDFNFGFYDVKSGDTVEYISIGSYLNPRNGNFISAAIVENNPHIFECPYEEKLTSEQWDEKARGYGYWIPMDGEIYFVVRVSLNEIHSSYIWCGDCIDMALLRAGIAFETRAEAEGLLKKLKGVGR